MSEDPIPDDEDDMPGLPSLSDDEIDESQAREDSCIEQLKTHWINERGAPEILDYEAKVVADVKEELDAQQELIDKCSDSKGAALMLRIYQMEVDRINFVLKAYLRTRLRKIEKHVLQILSQPELLPRLSKHEQNFAEKYVDLIEKNFNQAFLKHIPEEYASMGKEEMVVTAKLDRYVYARGVKDVGTVSLGESGDLYINQGDILVANYRHIKDLVKSGLIQLI
eukprot:CAMPEP_0170184364 /NCGR_PEP_ID=MMETSP0040_2-20121228/33457_1 /TAXON_ID=641309 /ORGANISM="Lotharella oceanica, Strain CCMP622" /LENGTH=223 /DNA_ID=CAMNT_0010430415 /DNA_START=1 /DNA_END=672 /DNA_ORIENTATION=+